jgi:hypothetical protein
MKINTPVEYAAALERANQLRGRGARADHSLELAALDAAIHAYEAKPDAPGDTPGRPTPDPYGKD